MDRALREAFNAAYTPEFYQRYQDRLAERFGMRVPFRLAETPFFVPPALRDRLARNAREIVAKISDPALIERMKIAVPSELDVPRCDALANCIQVDFAIVRDENGELDGKLVELQGFPSLYAFTLIQAQFLDEMLREMPGFGGTHLTPLFGHTPAQYVEKLRHAIVAGNDPREVILMDLDPPSQKTSPDFEATKQLLGVDAVCPTTLEREGRRLFRRLDGKRVQVKRIYNRVVFDELIKKGIELPFSYIEDLDVTWMPHPNWYWTWSKYTVPFVDHPSVPRARFLSEVTEVPDDLERYVLKPLFSFAGSGVKVDVTRADIDAIPHGERAGWILQEKITYAPDIITPTGVKVKAEVRMMFLRAPDQETPELVINLARLARGKMLGVDQNRDLDWVGGSVGMFPAYVG
ncbi:MAG: hypothetical protein WCJ30_13650 [Deltaproteobacteria bacterium]